MKKPFSKTYVILSIYSKLKKDRVIKKKDVLNELLISDLAFKRYMRDIRDFLKDNDPNYVITYDRKANKYYLEKRKSS